MRAVKRINPIWLLIALNIVLFVFRDLLLPDAARAAIAETVETTVLSLGVFGYAGIVLMYVLCGFFFVPLLIPLNILGGALYGAWAGTAVALAGITATLLHYLKDEAEREIPIWQMIAMTREQVKARHVGAGARGRHELPVVALRGLVEL